MISGWWGRCNLCIVSPQIGDLIVNRHRRPTSSAWAIVLLSAAALALGACGRKGALDLPPNIASPTASNVAPAPMDTQGEAMNRPGLSNPGYGSDAP